MSEHTPTPWRMDIDDDSPWIEAGDHYAVCMCMSDKLSGGSKIANAAFIVRAVNSHAALVAALKGVIAADNEFRSQLPPDWDRDPLADRIDEARAALSLAGATP